MVSLILFGVVAFVAGVLTFAAPCSLPMIPAYFAYATRSSKKKVARNTFLFGLGLSFVFALLGIFASTLGNFLISNKREIIILFGALMILLGTLTFFGIAILRPKEQKNEKIESLSSFFFGNFIALTWTGCIGPVLGFILIMAANTKTAAAGGLLLFLYGLGLVTPLFILSLIIDRLPEDSKFWKILRGKLFSLKVFGKEYFLHSTNIISGLLFIALGAFLIFDVTYRTTIGSISPFMSSWAFDLQDKLIQVFGLNR